MGKSLPLKVNPKRLDKTKQGECMEELQGFFTCMTVSQAACSSLRWFDVAS